MKAGDDWERGRTRWPRRSDTDPFQHWSYLNARAVRSERGSSPQPYESSRHLTQVNAPSRRVGYVRTMSGVQADHYRRQAEVCRQQAVLRTSDPDTVNIWLRLALEYEKMAQDAETVAQFEQRERVWRELLQPHQKEEGP